MSRKCEFCGGEVDSATFFCNKPCCSKCWDISMHMKWLQSQANNQNTVEKKEFLNGEKENATMQVLYKGFTGELVKLERKDLSPFGVREKLYDLSIYDSEDRVTHSFTGVKFEDVKFLGGAVTFGE